MSRDPIFDHPLVRELAAQLVEERFADVLQAERQDKRDAEAEAEAAYEKLQLVTSQRDRLRDALTNTLGEGLDLPATAVAEVRELRPRTGLTVHPGGAA